MPSVVFGTLRMLKVRRAANGHLVLTLSGRMDAESIAELETLIEAEPNRSVIVLDLKDLTLVSQDGVIFLERCETNSITLENCPPYIREWINRQRLGS